jgi:hypothetical protein
MPPLLLDKSFPNAVSASFLHARTLSFMRWHGIPSIPPLDIFSDPTYFSNPRNRKLFLSEAESGKAGFLGVGLGVARLIPG